jgi:hypothetical protein
VPENASNLIVRMSGGSGDADLYLRFDELPTDSNYDCRPFLEGNNETCTVETPQAGKWYFELHEWEEYSGISLTAMYDEEGLEPHPDPDPDPDPEP